MLIKAVKSYLYVIIRFPFSGKVKDICKYKINIL